MATITYRVTNSGFVAETFILVLYIPNQSADSEIKTKAGSPRVAPYDMMMWLCHDLMTDTV